MPEKKKRKIREYTYTIKYKRKEMVTSSTNNAIEAHIPFTLTYEDDMYVLSVTCYRSELDDIILGDCTDYFGNKNEPLTLYYISDYPEVEKAFYDSLGDDYNSHCSILEGGFDEPTADEWDRYY